MEEEFFIPVVQMEVFISVWELLYDWGKNLSVEEYKDLQKRERDLYMDDDSKESLTMFLFKVRTDIRNLHT